MNLCYKSGATECANTLPPLTNRTCTEARMATLTLARLREVLEYFPDTGAFRWRTKLGRENPYALRAQAGALKPEGYRVIRVDYVLYAAHRLAWFYCYGEWPDRKIDHRNGNRSDNRLPNLRLATDAENARNRTTHKGNRSGFKGVSCRKDGRFLASINGRHIGIFDSAEMASDAYELAADALHGDFASHRRKVTA